MDVKMPMYRIRADGIFANVVLNEIPVDHFRQEFHCLGMIDHHGVLSVDFPTLMH